MTKLFMNSRTVRLHIYPECKYTTNAEGITIDYDYVTGFEVVTGEGAEEIEAETDGSCIDDYHEYLVLFFEDGDTATFRNSYVDAFAL